MNFGVIIYFVLFCFNDLLVPFILFFFVIVITDVYNIVIPFCII